MGTVTLPSWVEQLRDSTKLGSTIEAYSKSPLLYRAVNLRCDAIATVPYRVERDGQLSDWYFKTPLPSLLRDTERSLLLTGAAFWLKLMKGKVLVGFQLLNPATVRVIPSNEPYNPIEPYKSYSYEQTIGTKTWKYTSNQIIYFREPSFTDEVGHGLASSEVAMQVSQLDYYQQRFMTAFFEGGAQPVTIMSMPTDTSRDELDRFKKDWTSRFNGVVNSFKTAFVRGGEIKPTVITPPIKDLMLAEMSDRNISQMSMALSVPRTLLEANSANYATAQNDRTSFYRDTIVPRLTLYSQVINNQLFHDVGYELIFQPEAMDIFQVDEAQRATSLKTLTEAGVPLNDAMIILGYDYEINADTELPASIAPPVGVQEEQPLVVDAADGIQVKTRAYTLWRRKAEKKLNAGKSLSFPFVSDDISEEDNAWIRHELSECETMHDIKSVFDNLKAMQLNDDERALYNALVAVLKKVGDDIVLQLRDTAYGYEVTTEDFSVVAEAIKPYISERMQDELTQLQDRYTIDIDDALEASLINKQIDVYTPKLIKGLTDTTRKLVKQVIDLARENGGLTNEQLTNLLSPAFGKRRAELIAVTEYTRAAAEATNVYQSYLGDYGIKSERIWNTEADEIVRKCPICYPLNGKPEEEWKDRYPQGAPAHPRCRCDVTLRIKI